MERVEADYFYTIQEIRKSSLAPKFKFSKFSPQNCPLTDGRAVGFVKPASKPSLPHMHCTGGSYYGAN